ncbi:hypothetical protein Tco_0820216 [Tanacetum coccineum]|uniref:Reverse transcriptase domain-containing protein n=1 Tax=Tanacetum coccineum TaxID=301880 RepID=A0ABQ5ABN6_9ASTR
MHTRASNSKLVEPLPEPERILHQRLCRRNRTVPYDQRNNPPKHPRIVYPPILNINYPRHFLDILQNYDLMDDEPIGLPTVLDTENEVVRLMMFPLSLTGEAKTWLDELNEGTIKTKCSEIAMVTICPKLLEDKVLLKLDWAKNQKTKSSLKKIVALADEGNSNSDTDKIMARMDAMTIKMDAQYKELQFNVKQPTPDLDDDDIPMSREEEAKFMKTFRKTYFYNDYRDRDSNPDNWHSSGQNDYNRDNC